MIDPLGRSRHPYRIPRAMSRLASLASMVGLLGGCGTLGSGTIVTARTPVNEAVATTSRQQTLMNIVRAHYRESPVILEIAEADEAVAVGGAATGGVSGIGSPVVGSLAGQIGSAAGTITAADNVTNRYIPLQGQALISQLSTQITVETINALYDSDWRLQSILELAVDRLTPAKDDFRYAEDILTHLDATNAIALATAKTGFHASKKDEKPILKNISIETQAPNQGGGDTLNVYLTPTSAYDGNAYPKKTNLDLWKRLYNLYNSTQPNEKGLVERPTDMPPSLIELRNSPRIDLSGIGNKAFMTEYLGPVFRTRTADGILTYVNENLKVGYVDLEAYHQIRSLPWNLPSYFRQCTGSDAYVVDAQSASPTEFLTENTVISPIHAAAQREVYKFIHEIGDGSASFDKMKLHCIYDFPINRTMDKSAIESEIIISSMRRFILIVKSHDQLSNTYTSWFSHGTYFSVMADDEISQRNLRLISQFLTIQATSTPTPSLTTISPSVR